MPEHVPQSHSPLASSRACESVTLPACHTPRPEHVSQSRFPRATCFVPSATTWLGAGPVPVPVSVCLSVPSASRATHSYASGYAAHTLAAWPRCGAHLATASAGHTLLACHTQLRLRLRCPPLARSRPHAAFPPWCAASVGRRRLAPRSLPSLYPSPALRWRSPCPRDASADRGGAVARRRCPSAQAVRLP